MPKVPPRAHYLPPPAFFLLDQACVIVNQAFMDDGWCFLVGSALERCDYRDVDVRCILYDEEFDRLFPGAAEDPSRNALWSLMCASIALMLSQRTGLPIDFQIQRQSDVNERHKGKVRNALGVFLRYPGGG